MEDTLWIWAAIALTGGLLIGEIGGRLARRAFVARSEGEGVRSAARRELGSLIGTFVFWLSTAIGLIVAIGLVDAEVLEELGDRLSDTVPSLGVAALVLIGGRAVSVVAAAMVGQSLRRATGVRQPAVERALQLGLMGAAVVVALASLGVQPSLIAVPIAIVFGAPALAFGLLSGLGGREVASQLAAGRALRHQLREGRTLRCREVEGRIIAMHPTTVEVLCADGSRAHIPNQWMLSGTFSVSD